MTTPIPPKVEEILQKLARTADQIHSRDELVERLSTGKPLRMKYGVDLTAPLLHIGHAVNLWMYRTLQEYGHKVVFLLGDFTTQIGDPTGRSKLRPVLSQEEIARNAEEFLHQVTMVLLDDPAVFEVRRNSEWFGKMSAAELLSLLTSVTHDRLIARDMFQRRIEEGSPIYMHELLYPILQGYDSVMLEADLTIVGTDQLFNEMMGRFFQERMGQKPQVLMTSVVTPGIDGKAKQSKSIGNYIGLGHTPREKYGRVMSIPDSLIAEYLRVYTDIPLPELDGMGAAIERDPMSAKRLLARKIVARYHGEGIGAEEEEWFTTTFSKRQAPVDAPVIALGQKKLSLLEVLQRCMPGESKSALRRLLDQRAVSLREEVITDGATIVEVEDRPTLQVGKRRWFVLGP